MAACSGQFPCSLGMGCCVYGRCSEWQTFRMPISQAKRSSSFKNIGTVPSTEPVPESYKNYSQNFQILSNYEIFANMAACGSPFPCPLGMGGCFNVYSELQSSLLLWNSLQVVRHSSIYSMEVLNMPQAAVKKLLESNQAVIRKS